MCNIIQTHGLWKYQLISGVTIIFEMHGTCEGQRQNLFYCLFSCFDFSSCRSGVQGDKCTECMDGYKNFSSSGCSPCNCDRNGSLSEVCNKSSHQCPCKVSTLAAVLGVKFIMMSSTPSKGSTYERFNSKCQSSKCWNK